MKYKIWNEFTYFIIWISKYQNMMFEHVYTFALTGSDNSSVMCSWLQERVNSKGVLFIYL
jgi:hypothetical protein